MSESKSLEWLSQRDKQDVLRKLIDALPKEREVSIHDQHSCMDEFCYTCNESIGEEEYVKYWTASTYNKSIAECRAALTKCLKGEDTWKTEK